MGRSANGKYAAEVPGQGKVQGLNKARSGGYYDDALMPTTRNRRDVWTINTVPYKGGHFAAFPPKLAETCILAGCPKGGVVLDPFFGSGTTGLAAKSLRCCKWGIIVVVSVGLGWIVKPTIYRFSGRCEIFSVN